MRYISAADWRDIVVPAFEFVVGSAIYDTDGDETKYHLADLFYKYGELLSPRAVSEKCIKRLADWAFEEVLTELKWFRHVRQDDWWLVDYINERAARCFVDISKLSTASYMRLFETKRGRLSKIKIDRVLRPPQAPTVKKGRLNYRSVFELETEAAKQMGYPFYFSLNSLRNRFQAFQLGHRLMHIVINEPVVQSLGWTFQGVFYRIYRNLGYYTLNYSTEGCGFTVITPFCWNLVSGNYEVYHPHVSAYTALCAGDNRQLFSFSEHRQEQIKSIYKQLCVYTPVDAYLRWYQISNKRTRKDHSGRIVKTRLLKE